MSKSCTYNGQTYDHGSVVCQSGYEYRCNDGSWDALNTKCSEGDGKIVTSATINRQTETADVEDSDKPSNSMD